MSFSLLELSNQELQQLAAYRVPRELSPRLDEGALPPPFVAARSLALGARGHPSPWSTTFLIVREIDDRIVGACEFKTAPMNGQVEVAYGVAPCARDQGAATEALKLLVTRAFQNGVKVILAEVAPENHASTRVVQKAGFAQLSRGFNKDNEYVVRWVSTVIGDSTAQ